MTNGPQEPNSAARAAAAMLRQYHLALLQEGFTRTEALTIVGYAIAAAAKP